MQDRIRNISKELLSGNWYKLWKYSYEIMQKNGEWENQQREAYDRGNGAAILLYNREKGTVILTRQFRLPTYINGNPEGYMIEACAGLLDKDNPEEEIRRETEEETGFRIHHVEKVIEAYMSPGSVTEILYLFVAEYNESMKVNDGGGLATEQENIEVMELPFSKAFDMIGTREIRDAKTILLLQHAKLGGLLN
ncbi:MAG: NUDIX domain-containing protein [Chitinophagaceae bacterium]|nr:MAG: NUDIX domain-containing protein [Chitinophagaceae bacterium]